MSDNRGRHLNGDGDGESSRPPRSWLMMVAVLALLFLLLIVLGVRASAAGLVITIVDGDTIYVDNERVRIVGLDAPTTYQAKCDAERAAGQQATNYLRSLVADGTVRLERKAKPDRYGRTLARIYVRGRNVACDVLPIFLPIII